MLMLTGGGLSTGWDFTSSTFSGSMSGQGTLYKFGSGTLTLSGANQLAAVDDVYGTLLLGVANALPSSALMEMWNGATLDLNGFSVTLASLGDG